MSGLEGGLGALLFLAALAAIWLSAVDARDLAVERARRFCKRQDWQLLDETVALRSLRLTRTTSGLRLQRRYRFEFSPEGTARRRGELVMIGPRLTSIRGELEDGTQLIEPQSPEDDAEE